MSELAKLHAILMSPGEARRQPDDTLTIQYAHDLIEMLRLVEQEHGALAAQVVAMREALEATNDIRPETAEHCMNLRDAALSIDASAAEAILREREAKAIASICNGCDDGATITYGGIRRLADERGACQECGMTGAHKLQCSTGGQTQLVLPAERRERK